MKESFLKEKVEKKIEENKDKIFEPVAELVAEPATAEPVPESVAEPATAELATAELATAELATAELAAEDPAVSAAGATESEDVALRHPIARKVIKLLPLVGLIICIVLLILAWNAGLLQSDEKMTQFVKDMGAWGPVVFLVITVASVVVPIIPFGLGLLAGVVIFGQLEGFILNYIGICIGSMLAFSIGRHVGRPILHMLFSEKQIKKYDSWIERIKFNWIFALAIFMPVAPDDYLVYFAGTTRMRWRFFTPIIWLGKPSSIFLYTFIIGKLFDGAVNVFSNM